MLHPLVSVIIPNYCHARYLDERIQSVLGQTYQNFELIILDDSSPDGGASREVIERYRANPKVAHIVYNDENSGSPFRQWDKGLRLAKGELAWIAESDDSSKPTFLQRCVEKFEQNDRLSYVFTPSITIDGEGKVTSEPRQEAGMEMDGKRFIRTTLLFQAKVSNASSAVFRRQNAFDIEPSYKEYKGAGDRLFWVRMAEKGDICMLGESLNCLRIHGVNTTSRCMVNGVDFIEDRRSFDALCREGFTTFWTRCRVVYDTWRTINTVAFLTPEIEQTVRATWRLTPLTRLCGWLHLEKDKARWKLRRMLKRIRKQ